MQLDESIRELLYRLGDSFVAVKGTVVIDEVKFGRAAYYAICGKKDTLETLAHYDVPDGYVPGGRSLGDYLDEFAGFHNETALRDRVWETLVDIVDFELERLGIAKDARK